MKNIGNTIQKDYTLAKMMLGVLGTYKNTHEDSFAIGFLTGVASGIQFIHGIKPGDSRFSEVMEGLIQTFDEIYGEENGKLALGLQQFEMREGKSENFSAGMNEGHDWSTLYLRGVNDEPVVPMELITYLSLNHELKDEK